MSEEKTNSESLDDAKEKLGQASTDFKSEVIDIEYEGHKFQVDTGRLDDVDALEMIDAIENQNNMKVIVDFLQYLIGAEAYDTMKAYFVQKDGRFKISTLSKIYVAIFDKFDPKG